MLTDELDTMASVFQRLTQRKIVQWAIAYVAGAWLLLEVLGFVAENFGWPAGIVRGATVFLGIGFFVMLVLAGAASAYVSRGSAPEESETGAPPTLAIDPRAIAVLPFANRSAEGENAAFFAEGMHNDILTTLAKIGSLTVISRASVLQYAGTRKPMPEIAEELRVATVLEGSVQRAAGRVRLNVQLIDARADKHMWAETYDQELTAANIFEIQTGLAKKIAGTLRATLTPEVEERWGAQPTESLEAYDLLLRANHVWDSSKDGLKAAADLYLQAIAADSDYALAWVSLARAYLEQWSRAYLPPETALPEARAAVERALALEPNLAAAHAVRGWGLVFELRYDEAEEMLLRALELNPGSADAHGWYGSLLQALERYQEAVREARRAVELDPLSVRSRDMLAYALWSMRDWNASIAEWRKSLEIEPDSAKAYAGLGLAYAMKGEHVEAVAAMERARRLAPEDPYHTVVLAWTHAHAGHREEALGWLANVPEQGAMLREIAIVYGELGEMDLAYEYLERVADEDPGSLATLARRRVADPLRADPRYKALMKRVGLQ